MKKWILRIGGAAIALLIVVLVIVFFSLNSIVKTGVETVGPKLTRTEMRLEGVKLSPFSGNGELSGFFLGNPEGYKTPSAVKVGDIKVGLQLSSVLSDTVVVEEVKIQAPEITFEGSLGGNNLSQILSNLEAATGGASTNAPAEPAAKSDRKFFVKDVLIQGGKIHLSMTALGGKAMTVPLPEIHLQDIGSRENGVSAAELSAKIMKAMTASVTKAVGEAVTDLGKGVQDVGKGAAEQMEKATKGLKDLFKK